VEPERLLRIVALRGGKLRPSEFRLREGEVGLSAFGFVDATDAGRILELVRAAGKAGELAAVTLPAGDLRQLGLVVVATPGATGDPDVDARHYEVLLPDVQIEALNRSGVGVAVEFNGRFGRALSQMATILSS
jgi:hypothetical protein